MRHVIPIHDGRTPQRRLGIKTVVALLVLIPLATLAAVQFSARFGLLDAQHSEESEAPAGSELAGSANPDPLLFRDWPDALPDLVLVLSGQQSGYLNPCGCSRPQYGGLQRRYTFMEGLRQRGWPVAGVDLGDVLDQPAHRGPQALLKYQTSMKALRQMGYLAVGLGQFETEMPLIATLAEYALNQPVPRILAANLKDKETNFPGMLGSWTVGSPTENSLRVGVVGVIGPTIRKLIPQQNPAIDFDENTPVLAAALKALEAQTPDVRVLLYQGSMEEGRSCARTFQEFNVILCQSKESEPSDKPERVGTTWVVSVGHKGRYVGVVGFWKTGKPDRPFDVRYQLVMLGETYETPADRAAANPVMQLLEGYARDVQQGNYLARYPRSKHPVQLAFPDAEYVGSAECKSCHRHAYEIWKNHPHSHAYHTLETAKRPSLRQFDGECVVCHTVGFGIETGYADEQKTANLKDVGCENCHGPGSLHVQMGKKTPAQMLALMNPFKPQPNETPEQEAKRLLAQDLSCQKCHDVDNDVHWNFKKKWPLVVHRTPNKHAPANAPQVPAPPAPANPDDTVPAKPDE
jgi:cytochrome c554/c'-like protein